MGIRSARVTILLLLAAAVLGLGPRASIASASPDPAAEANWILAQRVTTGPDLGLIPANGGGYCVPYFSNIAASGLAAATTATGDARYVNAAWDWLDWYGAHMDASGFVANHRLMGTIYVSTGQMDSTDGYAGTFLTAVGDAWVASRNTARLDALWPAVRKAVDAVLATDNGAWLTWAKPSYRHAFIMDNVEVYEGFRAVERLAGEGHPDASLRALAGRWVANMPAALQTYWSLERGGYDVAISANGTRFPVDWNTLYPAASAQAWMIRTGLVEPDRARTLMERINATFSGWDRSGEQSPGAWWPELVESNRQAGLVGRAAQGLATMASSVISLGRMWLYHVGNAGVIIKMAHAVPDTILTQTPGAFLRPGSATTAFTGAPSLSATTAALTYACSLDAGPWTPCVSPYTSPAVADGTHSLAVRSTDSAGVVDPTPALVTWVTDGTAPVTRILSTPTEPSNASPIFVFEADDLAPADVIAFECATDGSAFVPCASGRPVTIAESTGSHNFAVRATDPAGNVGQAVEHTFVADGIRPSTLLQSGPIGVTTSAEGTFTFDGSDDSGSVTFECRLGSSSAYAACVSPHTVSLSEGAWMFQVRSVDPAGNADASPVVRVWTIDRSPPSTSIGEAPALVSRTQSARFLFSGTDNVPGSISYECALDSAAFARCVSPRSVASLAAGNHVFQVRAVDAGGFVDPTPARYEWTVDLVVPRATIGTPENSILVDLPPIATRAVAGIATDDRSGVDSVTVRFSPTGPGGTISMTADVVCANVDRRSCRWSVAAPRESGRYRVTLLVADAAGNLAPATPGTTVVFVV